MRTIGSPLRASVLALALVAVQFGNHALANAEHSPSPPIEASIHTSWAAPPLLLEILEAVAVENRTAYQPLMRQLTDTAFLDSVSTPKALYEESLRVIEAHGHVAPQAISSLKWSLAMHTSAPWIEAHYHLYNSTIAPDRLTKPGFNSDCGVWVDWYGRQICTVAELKSVIAANGVSTKRSNQRPTTMDLDHINAPADASDPFTILYADVYDPEFAAFREYLDTIGKDHGLEYSLRYRPPVKGDKESPLTLSGFGVELALKNTDYIVIDDRDLGHGDDSAASGQTVFKNNAGTNLLGDDEPSVEPISESLLADVGLAAAQFVATSEEPLKTLVSVAQDFPKYQAKISKMTFDPALKSIVRGNQGFLAGGAGKVWLNNQPVPSHKMNPFSLLRMMRRDRQTITSLATMGVSAQKAVELLTDASDTDSGSGAIKDPEGVLDVRDKSEDKSLIVWLNDLQSDNRYKDWSADLINIVRPTYNGQFHQIRRNLISTLFALDFSSPKALELVSFELTNYIQRLVPFRFGVLPLLRSDDGVDAKMAMLWRHVVSRHGIKGGLEFLKRTLISHIQQGQDLTTASKKSFAVSLQSSKLKSTTTPEMTYEEVIATDSVYRSWLTSVKAMTDRVGISGESFFINGKYFAWEENHGQYLMLEAPSQTTYLANKLMQGEISGETDLYDYFLTRPGVAESRNPYIFVSEEVPLKVVDLVQGQSRPFVDTLSYISTGEQSEQTTTAILTANFEKKEGVALALEALKAVESELKTVRVALVQNGKAPETLPGLANFVRQSSVDGKALPLGFWKDLLEGVSQGGSFLDSFQQASSKYPEVALIGMEGSKGREKEADESRKNFLRDIVQAKDDDTFIVINGRVVGPLLDPFRSADFRLLVNYEQTSRINKIKSLLVSHNIAATASNIMKAGSIVHAAAQQLDQSLYDINESQINRDRTFAKLDSELAGFSVNSAVYADQADILYHFTAVLDPASQLTQQWAPILETVSKMANVKVDIVLQPSLQVTELPIKRFYRYVAEPELTFDSETGNLVAPTAYFAGLPQPTLLTLGVDVNPAWVVTSKVCIHDLDNLKLSSLTGASRTTGVQAEFELQNILVEGFARDISQKVPPKGAQFILGTKAVPHVADTLVMANMGYFQLKANPGVWEMVLRPGRTHEVFSIESIGSEGWVPGGVKNDKRDVVIANFEGLVLYPRLVRNPGMEQANVQDEVAQEGGIWSSIKTTIKGLTQPAKPTKKKAEINIFSVASGHLYERFLSIMILSVIKNTDSRVKFWFIENFLSPSFKDFIPHMAEKYDFDYELVTYNWPHWLRAQTEKQRIIWAYKILFLDVLFPLDLDKVIFVDADQIVRADMKELVDLDLKGAPYGYTPMCQDRTEMEGFRFWNQGYWKDHLRGKPYHISALYVIDLVRFRQMQAGDRLRNHYQQLSRDPHSLANLDQDLPNNMQNDVPIFSLPQEWLWCETWCGDEGLAKAKTIDLCNNPLTKEPKLDRARRQIKEWEDYDNEATEFAKKVNAELKQARRQAEATSAPTQAQDSHAIKDEL
ncbi:hypothetical protein BG005_004658 [Podila minutissima]|nr:hypothetical protein BG005_004658 [Podila minutissima]